MCIFSWKVGNAESRVPRQFGTAAPESGEVALLVGLVLSFVLPVQPGLEVLIALWERLGFEEYAAFIGAAAGYNLALGVAIIALVKFWEARPLESIGFRSVSIGDIGAAVVAFVFAAFLSTSLWVAIHGLTPVENPYTQTVLGGTLLALSGSFAEEVGSRAYAIERLSDFIGSPLSGAIFALAGNLAMHVPQRGLQNVLLIAPGEGILVLLYLYRRSVWSCILAHFLLDISTLVGNPISLLFH